MPLQKPEHRAQRRDEHANAARDEHPGDDIEAALNDLDDVPYPARRADNRQQHDGQFKDGESAL